MLANGARQAFEFVNDADATFLDLKMPGVSGIDFLRETKPELLSLSLRLLPIGPIPLRPLYLEHLIISRNPSGRSDLQRVLTEALKKPQIARSDTPSSADDFIGFSSEMREVQKKIGVAASGEVTISTGRECRLMCSPLETPGSWPISWMGSHKRSSRPSWKRLAEFEKFYGELVPHFPWAVLWHDPGKLKAFTDLFRQRVRRDNFCECN